jgi:environmental stress-induced protein Ves
MPVVELIRLADRPPVPWKNGAGTTRELWARRDAAGAVLIRVSIAEISGTQDFSAFPGIDRVILQLDGPPMVLTIDGQPCPLRPLDPQPFPGEARVACRLEGTGAAHDLNLMCQRSAFGPRMQHLSLRPGERISLGGAGGVAAVLALGALRLSAPMEVALSARDLVVGNAPFEIEATHPGEVIVLEARPV